MSEAEESPVPEDRSMRKREQDTHGEVRFFKLLEVAYNCARNGYYGRAAVLAEQACAHYEEVNDGE